MIKEINLNEWIKVGEGATADSYNKKGDKTLLLKLFHEDRSPKIIEDEFESAKKIQSIGFLTPKVYELVKYKNQFGIIFERLVNKVSYSRLCADNPSKIADFAKNYAIETKKLHMINLNKNEFLDKKQQIMSIIKLNKVTWKKDQNLILNFLENYEDSTTLVHGDLHSGNLLLVDNQNHYWIDTGDLGYGSYWFDVGSMYLVCKEVSNLKQIQDNLHMNKKQLANFWEGFAKEYFNTDELELVNLKARVFALLRLCQRIIYAGKSPFILFLCKIIYGSRLTRSLKNLYE